LTQDVCFDRPELAGADERFGDQPQLRNHTALAADEQAHVLGPVGVRFCLPRGAGASERGGPTEERRHEPCPRTENPDPQPGLRSGGWLGESDHIRPNARFEQGGRRRAAGAPYRVKGSETKDC
jgi:hypothetical protein